jgi:restriction system protein
MIENAKKVRTWGLPTYSSVAQLLTILDGESKSKVTDMVSAIWDQKGTPQKPTDWSDPDVWITECLSGDSMSLARRIWEESSHSVNPRYIQGINNFINIHGLVADGEGLYRLSERGEGSVPNLL